MAYYSGQIAGYQELLNIIFQVCADNGWTLNDSILCKSTAHVELNYVASGNFPGITCRGGSSVSFEKKLIDASPVAVRLGRPVVLSQGGTASHVTFPANYYIHILENEVYIVLHHSVDAYWKLAFGFSELHHCRMWASAVASGTGPTQGGQNNNGSFAINWTGSGNDYLSTGQPFWQSRSGVYPENIMLLQNGWASGFNAAASTAPLIQRLPSAWNSESILLPIDVMYSQLSSKISLVLSLEHARYLRIDNLSPGQILTIGNEKWIVYPAIRKNSKIRDGESTSIGSDHSGTFGLAIRYDGL